MRYQGWVSLASLGAFIGLSVESIAEDRPGNPQPRPIPDLSADAISENERPRPPRTLDPVQTGAEGSLEEELRLLREELKEFQTLGEDVRRTTKDAEAENDRAAMRQRQELLDLLTRLATRGAAKKPLADVPSKEPSTRSAEPLPPQPAAEATPSFPVPDDVVDPFSLGKVLFRSGDYVAAEQAFRKAKPTDENRQMLKYLIATCLRKRSQLPQAIEAYRSIASSDQDPVLRDLARWQIENIRWHQQTELQLEQMRQQRESRTDSKSLRKNPTAAKP